MHRLTYHILLICGLLLYPLTHAHAATFEVTSNGDDDCGDLACNLQAALTTAQNNDDNDVLNLAAGVYNIPGETFFYIADDGNPDGTEENFSLTLQGTDAATTILDGGNVKEVLFIRTTTLSDDSAAALHISGLTLRNGFQPASGMTSRAGGLFVLTESAPVVVEGCLLHDNGTPNLGGAAYIETVHGNVTVQSNHFLENAAVDRGGGLMALTGDGTIMAVNNVFAHNTARLGGASLLDTDNGRIALINNTFYENDAITAVPNDGRGGGIFIVTRFDDSEADIYNNLFYLNRAGEQGDDIFANVDGDDNLIFAPLRLFNNLFAEFCSVDLGGCDPTALGDDEGDNVIGEDPLLLDPASGDFHLQAGSPLIGQGSGLAPDLPGMDFEGDPRVLGATPDIGADEASTCGDGSVNTNTGETCDDGNTAANDGCDASCQLESGFTCAGEPSVCSEDSGGNGNGSNGGGSDGSDNGNAGGGCSLMRSIH